MTDLRRVIGVTQIILGILIIIGTTYFSNLFAASHMQFTENAGSHFQALEKQGAPTYSTIQANYILLSNLYLMLLINLGISTILILLAIMMIFQGVVNKFAVPGLHIGYKPLLWLGLIGMATIFVVLLLTQYFVRYYF